MSVESMSSTVDTHFNSIQVLCANITHCLVSALDLSGENVGTYSGSMISSLNTEYVDLIVMHFLLIKCHLSEIKKYLDHFSAKEDLQHIFVGLQNTIDQLDVIRINNWFIQYTFSFLIEEIQSECKEMMETFSLYTLVA